MLSLTKKSPSLERNIGPSFALDNTTGLTDVDADVNKGQVSLGEWGLVSVGVVSAEVTAIYGCTESQVRSKTALDVFHALHT